MKIPFVATAERGYTLIEVLVALLVISLGLLGMAGLQISALKQNQNAYVRSQVFISAQDIVGRMRANTPGVSAGNYFGAPIDVNGIDTSCDKSSCSTSDLATYDLNNWRFNLQQEVAGGGGCVTRKVEIRKGFSEDKVADLDALCSGNVVQSDPVVIYVWWSDSHYKNEKESDNDDDDIKIIALSAEI